MHDMDRMRQRVQKLNRAAKWVLIGGCVLPFVVVGILLAGGAPPGALGVIFPFSWWCMLGLFLLLKAMSFRQSAKTYLDNDPQLSRIRSRATIYTTLCVLVAGPLLLLIGIFVWFALPAWVAML